LPRLPPRTDLADQFAAWANATTLSVRRPRVRRPTAASRLEADGRQRAAFEVLEGGRAIVLRGSPADPGEIPWDGYSRAATAITLVPTVMSSAALAYMIFGRGIGVLVLGFFTGCVCLPISAATRLPSLRTRRACAAIVEWYITKGGIEIVRGRSRERIPAAGVAAIELHRPSGVPQLVLTCCRSLFWRDKLVPHNWGGRSPDEAMRQIRSTLLPELAVLGETGSDPAG
jgi:hypothetical protein